MYRTVRVECLGGSYCWLMLPENIHTEMSVIEYVIQLNLVVDSEEVNKQMTYIKQAVWLKCTDICAFGSKCMQCALLGLWTGNCGGLWEREK